MNSFSASLTERTHLSLWQLRARAEDELRRRGVSGGACTPEAFAEKYWSRPSEFLKDNLLFAKGEHPASYQLEHLDLLHQCRRVAVRACHGAGKTAEAAWAVLHFAMTREAAGADWKVVTTASVWRQLSLYLWPEIHKWTRRMKSIPGLRRWHDEETQVLAVKLAHGQAFAVASNDKDKIEGAHASELLYILDEAKAIPDATWDAIEGALASGSTYALAISTPGAAAGRFYNIHQRKPGYEDWTARHVTLDEAVAAGRVSRAWAEQREAQWGSNSPVYQSRVLGQFAETDEQALIPLAWVEAAQQRWQEHEDTISKLSVVTSFGVDVARSGADETAIATRASNTITAIEVWSGLTTMETTGLVVERLNRGGVAVIDADGIGAGVYDRLKEQGKKAAEFHSGARPFETRQQNEEEHGSRRYLNLRARAWWAMRERLDPEALCEVSLPPDDALTADLTTPTWGVTSVGAVQIESKDEIRKRLGRSPDRGDAVVMAFSSEWLPSLSELEFL
jgi:hypothetical protein